MKHKGPPSLCSDDEIRALHRRYLAGESPETLRVEAGYKRGGLRAAFRRLKLPPLGLTHRVNLDDPRAIEALQLWHSGATAKAAGEEVGFSQTLMTRLLKEAGLQGIRSGPEHFHWKGGRAISDKGYVYVWISTSDPLAAMRSGNSAHVSEHRLVMARHLGRPLKRYETVHHINGNRQDNRLENLEVRIGPHGNGSRWRCADCGSTHLAPVELG